MQKSLTYTGWLWSQDCLYDMEKKKTTTAFGQLLGLYHAATSHLYFLYLSPYGATVRILFFQLDKQTALSSLGKCESKDALFVLCVKKKKGEKKKKAGPRLLVLQPKMSSWPCNKSHRVVMCLLITVQCIAVIHTLIYSLGPLCTQETHSAISSLSLLLLYLMHFFWPLLSRWRAGTPDPQKSTHLVKKYVVQVFGIWHSH